MCIHVLCMFTGMYVMTVVLVTVYTYIRDMRSACVCARGHIGMPTAKFQTIYMRKPNRGDHVWMYLKYRGYHKCVLCGAITSAPPPYPTPEDWMPKCYEKLTDEERLICVEKV